MNFRALTHVALGATFAASALIAPSSASACGGFFCDSAQPVNQQAERIIFAKAADGSVTAVIQIQYQGPSEKFAWMLPVSGSPTIAVSSNAAFDRLQAATNPTYQLNTQVEGQCMEEDFSDGSPSAGADDDDSDDSGEADGGEVTVVDSGSVGPYDYSIIKVDPKATDAVASAITWLNANGYDVPELGSAVLRPYLDGGMNLLAFKLTKGNDTGSIRPVMLSFGQGLPSIPIRPTAVAAQPDMGVMVWVLGEQRAIPANYRSLELNEALINWLNPNLNYNDVVTRAANEAQGQGFVTEHSGAASPLAEAIWQPYEADQWARIKSTNWSAREGELLNELGNFTALDGMRELLSAVLKPPSNLSADEFYSCLPCYLDSSMNDIDGFEPAKFVADMQTKVIDPIVETQKLFQVAAKSTRLYTTMSAHEMTMDPMFDFNPDLPEVSNVHQADRIIECAPSVYQFEAPWRVQLASGHVVRGQGSDWPFAADTDKMPANARISRVGNSGMGEVVQDNIGGISQALTEHNKTIPGPSGDPNNGIDAGVDPGSDGGLISEPVGKAKGGGGCSVGSGGAASALAGLYALAGVGLMVVRRRRRG